MDIKNAATVLINRAIEFDRQSRFIEALTCYQEGLNLLLDQLKSMYFLQLFFKFLKYFEKTDFPDSRIIKDIDFLGRGSQP